MRIVVAGAGGMLGRDVVAAARARGHDCVPCEREQLDVTDAAATRRALADAGPELVINCAAWTDVDGAEADEAGAFAVNARGAAHLAVAARECAAALIHISTDYVFAGTATRPYVESDATDPRSAYGRTKLAGELGVLAASPAHAVVRTAWLFGAGGRSFVSTLLDRAAAGQDRFAVVTDQIGCPTFTGHLAEKLLDLGEEGRRGLYHEAGAGRCSWHELAQAIFAAGGLDVEVAPTTSAEYVRPAPRPAWSVLASERDREPLPAWRDGLAAYLSARAALR